MNNLLNAREERSFDIKNRLSTSPTVILIKSNIPGSDKKIKEAYIICRVFFCEIKSMLSIKSYSFIDYEDGPSFLISLDLTDAHKLKQQMILLEENHPLGRFIDIDVFASPKSISRVDLGYPNRKCYLCEKDAHYCTRNQTHPLTELLDFVKLSVRNYLIDWIDRIVDESMSQELDLENKFGLVTKTSSGSHKDMNYELMLKAKDAIKPYWRHVFLLGYDQNLSDIDLFHEARKMGKQAEKNMIESTNGINAYKGLIFILGFMILAFGYDLNKKDNGNKIFEDIKKLSLPVQNDFREDASTFGLKAFHHHQFMGARGEVIHGFPTLQKVIQKYDFLESYTDHSLRMILVEIILNAEDSVLLKRAGSIEKYKQFKDELKKIDLSNPDEVTHFNQKAIDQNISLGGSADLLITYLCLKKYVKHFFIT
jgi:holo-ACP synthase CitX